MPTVRDVIDALEEIAPRGLAFDWDRVGLQVGDERAAVRRILVSLDSTEPAMGRAVESGAEMWVAHHPLLWEPTLDFTSGEGAGRAGLPHALARAGIAFAAAHTNWDNAPGGLNDALARRLGLLDVERPPRGGPSIDHAKVVVFVPLGSVEAIVDAMAEAGAGEIEAYRRCAFLTRGQGTFFGTADSSPVVGEAGRVETVEEVRVEMVAPASRVSSVLAAIGRVHPYETAAVDVYPLQVGPSSPSALRVGRLAEPLSPGGFQEFVDDRLATRCSLWLPPRMAARGAGARIETVGLVGGAASGMWPVADCDVFLTGEVKQDHAVESVAAGRAICAAGHYATEQPGMVLLATRLASLLPGVGVEVYEPEPGQGGRPLA